MNKRKYSESDESKWRKHLKTVIDNDKTVQTDDIPEPLVNIIADYSEWTKWMKDVNVWSIVKSTHTDCYKRADTHHETIGIYRNEIETWKYALNQNLDECLEHQHEGVISTFMKKFNPYLKLKSNIEIDEDRLDKLEKRIEKINDVEYLRKMGDYLQNTLLEMEGEFTMRANGSVWIVEKHILE